jgi:hypothetical protein
MKRTTNFYSVPLAGGITDIVAFMAKGIDVSDTEFFTYETAATGAKPNDGFTVTATSTEAFGAAEGIMTYRYDPAATPPGSWAADGTIILDDMLPTQPCISGSEKNRGHPLKGIARFRKVQGLEQPGNST